MESQDRREIVENISYLLAVNDTPKLKNFTVDTHPADLADIMRELNEAERTQLFTLLEPEIASDVMLELDEVSREVLIADMEDERLSEIVDEMDSDDATDVVAELPDILAEKVLSQIDDEDRVEVEQLIQYEEDTAGGIMALEYISVFEDQTVDDAIQQIREKTAEVDEVFNVYVVDRQNHLVGILPLKKLVISHPKQKVSFLVTDDVISVTVDKDQEYVAGLVRKYDLVAIPVVDEHNRLLGRITIDDIIDVLQEEAEEDIQRMAGISDDEVLQETSTLRISRNRLPWLVIAFVGQLIAAFVMYLFEPSLKKIMALTFFVPVIMAMGGNAGIQSSTIIVRSIALAEGGTSNRWKRMWRELRVSMLNGAVFGLLMSIVVLFWPHFNDPFLGVVIGFSLLVVIVNSAVFGAIIPFTLNRFNIDPAIATGPFITTFNDIIGLLIYFTLTTGYLKYFS